jgi:hypothetical protein
MSVSLTFEELEQQVAQTAAAPTTSIIGAHFREVERPDF